MRSTDGISRSTRYVPAGIFCEPTRNANGTFTSSVWACAATADARSTPTTTIVRLITEFIRPPDGVAPLSDLLQSSTGRRGVATSRARKALLNRSQGDDKLGGSDVGRWCCNQQPSGARLVRHAPRSIT